MRKHSPLPEGYRIEESVTLRLFNAQGKLVEEVAGSPNAAARAEARAWQDAWEQIERELREDLHALREGIRPIQDLRRLRQYMRMLDAAERAPIEAQEQASRATVVRRRALGGLALAAAAALPRETRSFAVSAVDLMQSELGPGGPRYSVLASAPLHGRGT